MPHLVGARSLPCSIVVLAVVRLVGTAVCSNSAESSGIRVVSKGRARCPHRAVCQPGDATRRDRDTAPYHLHTRAHADHPTLLYRPFAVRALGIGLDLFVARSVRIRPATAGDSNRQLYCKIKAR